LAARSWSRGKVAIAGARLAYAVFGDITRSARWRSLEAQGAGRQRLLWASTGTKNPEYSDVVYVESLIGPDTITTVPPETLKLFEDHGVVSRTLDGADAADAARVMEALAAGGIDFRNVNRTLEDEGIEKFARSFEQLLAAIGEVRSARA
jgi:transaldolase/glucose-6-phosphate isomerase